MGVKTVRRSRSLVSQYIPMLKQITTLALSGILACGVSALPASALPTPNENGDYGRTSHRYWKVVDPDPNGLNCRMGRYSYPAIASPRSDVTLDILNWSPVGTLDRGERFEIELGPAGFGILTDTRGKPWFYVRRSFGEYSTSCCFVRANSSFVVPVERP
ncbi:hypothetical protein [Phormidium sp. CCY1219]|uniref:hypothetical protein n=1 Tax=Phormidium sp. CCY1219 TaxID=2886104 RepID=UPI002D1E8C8B|nr:hypothetical protein [Phormidium sp. CCY1219]MEB3826420.1 hypothetical protein [Phormidium sp. CCY1219]